MTKDEQQKLLTETFNSFKVPKEQHAALLRFIQKEAEQRELIAVQKMLIAASQVLEEKHRFTHEMATDFVVDTTAVFVATEKARLGLDGVAT